MSKTKPNSQQADLPALYCNILNRGTDGTATQGPAFSTPGALERLPADVVREIIDVLPPSSAAALAFTNRRMLYCVGIKPWTRLYQRKDQPERWQFLQCLDSTLPDHLLCFVCKIYHSRRSEEGRCDVDKPLCTLSERSKVSYLDVQQALRVQKYGSRYGMPLQVPESTSDSAGWIVKIEVRFDFDRQIIARQTASIQLLSEHPTSHGKAFDTAFESEIIPCCDHFKNTLKTQSESLIKMEHSCSLSKKCHVCRSEYFLEFERSSTKEIHDAFFISRYTDLSTRLGPKNHPWKAHAQKGKEGPLIHPFDESWMILRDIYDFGKHAKRLPLAR